MNRLERIDEFREVLSGYEPSKDAKKIADSAHLTPLVGPSASGKNSIIDLLVERGGYQSLITSTTREKRLEHGELEKEGVHYYFISETEFLKGLKKGEFLEAAIIHGQQVSGISEKELKRIADIGNYALTDFEIVGTLYLLEHVPSTLAIFVLPPSFEEWMARMDKRGELSQDERKRRMVSAQNEIEKAINHPKIYFIVNDEVKTAADTVEKLVKLHKTNQIDEYNRGEDVDEVAWRILNNIKHELSS